MAAAGAAVAFVANALSPRGLSLTRNYFPAQPLMAGANNQALLPTATNAASAAQLLAARLKAQGLRLGSSNEVLQLFRDPRGEDGSVVFIDARNDEQYQGGHIPGAYQLDYYRREKYLPALLPVCQAAQQIVIYCHGGDCEDSEMTAGLLTQFNIAKEKLLVYGGGITEWSTNGWPIETGPRKSGAMRPGK